MIESYCALTSLWLRGSDPAPPSLPHSAASLCVLMFGLLRGATSCFHLRAPSSLLSRPAALVRHSPHSLLPAALAAAVAAMSSYGPIKRGPKHTGAANRHTPIGNGPRGAAGAAARQHGHAAPDAAASSSSSAAFNPFAANKGAKKTTGGDARTRAGQGFVFSQTTLVRTRVARSRRKPHALAPRSLTHSAALSALRSRSRSAHLEESSGGQIDRRKKCPSRLRHRSGDRSGYRKSHSEAVGTSEESDRRRVRS